LTESPSSRGPDKVYIILLPIKKGTTHMIKELKKTYELLPKQPGEIGRYLTVNEIPRDGFEIRMELIFDNTPKLGAAYTVSTEELRSAKFDYENHAIENICYEFKRHLNI
jgi:hypothetical protein